MVEPYDGVADEYIAMFGDRVTDPATNAALDLLGDITGLRVLDAPCGNGRVARELVRRGAREVVAVDVSSAMLERARTTGRSDGVTFELGDLTSGGLLTGERFDAIVCNYGLNEIEDLPATMQALHRLLDAGGPVVASILHPCFPGLRGIAPGSWPPDGYYREGRWVPETADIRAKLGTLHRMLSTYVNTIIRAGFVLEELSEPPLPGVDPVPMFLAIRCRRT